MHVVPPSAGAPALAFGGDEALAFVKLRSTVNAITIIKKEEMSNFFFVIGVCFQIFLKNTQSIVLFILQYMFLYN